MTPRARSSLRREPSQPRAKEMVERIIAAGQAVLLERGYDATTTNHIARAAGISPGSLYQYFPDKAAVLSQVIERYSEDVQARLSRGFLRTLRSDSREVVRANVTNLLDVCEENPGLLRVLVEQVPRSDHGPRVDFAHRADEWTTTALLSAPHRDPGRPAEAISWILVRTVEHVTISYVLERPDIARDTVIDELTELITGYLDRIVRPKPGV
jgi:AcrR family transcriptional regulator